MSATSLAGLFICNLVVFSYGNGFVPLLPLYAENLGANGEMAGYCIALSYACLAAGTFLAGRLSDSGMGRRALLAATGLLAAPLLWLLASVTTIWQLVLVNGSHWFLMGACLSVVGTIAGREARARNRGTVFGILGTTIAVGSLVGGVTMGRMVDAWGYSRMFLVAAGSMLLIPLASAVAVRETTAGPRHHDDPKTVTMAPVVTGGLLLLVFAEILTMLSVGEGNLGRSLQMSGASFASSAITMTAAVGGIATLPLPFVLGRLSDRIGRGAVIMVSPVAGAGSLLLLLVSHALWQFLAVGVLNSLSAVSISVGPALVADVVRRERVGTGISIFQASIWVGMILGFSFSGIAFQRLGPRTALLLGALSAIVAVPLILVIRAGRRTAPGTSLPGGVVQDPR